MGGPMEPILIDQQRGDSYGRRARAMGAFLQRQTVKMSHREDAIEAAVTKRERKNAKRLRDAERAAIGQLAARERLAGIVVSA